MKRTAHKSHRSLHLPAQLCIALLLALLLSACNGNELPDYQSPVDATVVGYTTVALDVNKSVVRSGEAPVGNLVADAMFSRLAGRGQLVDMAFINGGNLRFNVEHHADGIIPAGELSKTDIDDLLPFGNKVVILEVTGSELKSTLERSVAQLPSSRPHGAFLQLSQALHIQVDLTRPAQVLDESVNPAQLVSEGARIRSISLRGLPLQLNAHYLIAVPDFIATGGDGYVALRDVPADRRFTTELLLLDLVTEYLQLFQPVSPQVDGRIVFLP